MKVAWLPHPGKQTFALQRQEFEILYGGARGGGKTEAGMAFLSRWIDNSLFRGLVLRKNSEDLKDWTDRATRFYKHLNGKAVGTPTRFVFPSGAIIYTGHIKDNNAYTKYQGQQFQKIVWEELTQTPSEDLYEKVIASCRSTVSELTPQVFCTTNPGEIGHHWVKRRFIDVADPMQTHWSKVDIDGKYLYLSRIFIPATLDDNPTLMIKDHMYVARITNMSDEATRMRWRYGSWDDLEVKGSYYQLQINQAKKEGRISIVDYDNRYKVNTAWDIGVSDSTAIWFFQEIEGKVKLIDYFETNGEGMKFYVDEIIKKKPYIYEKHYAPHDISTREFGTGKTRLETAYDMGIKFDIVPKISIADGINAVRLTFGDCYFDEKKCETGINALINYRKKWNPEKQIYSDEAIHDWTSHGSDAFRYLCTVIQKKQPIIHRPSSQEILKELKANELKNLQDFAFGKKEVVESDMLPYENENIF